MLEVLPQESSHYSRLHICCASCKLCNVSTSMHNNNMHEPCSLGSASHLGNNMLKNDDKQGKDDNIFDLDGTSDKHLLAFTKTPSFL